jgi:ATP-dependent DNA helicase RecQ
VLPVLHELFGYDALRPGQGAVIANVLAGRDTLATMPTGAGKSLTFQLPAMLREGTTLVLSPLIALMADQVASLPPAIREQSLLVNSTLSRSQQQEALARIAAGEVKLVYAAPERLRDAAFLDALHDAGTGLVVIDEAHCISLWGHDFRPDYLTIPRALPAIGTPSILAITATATPGVANGIAEGLGRPLDRIRASVFRSNLFYEAHHHANRDQKIAHLLDICQRERGAGIVYVPSRNDAENLAGLLRSRRISAVPYHAGLDKEVRAENQRAFMRGQARIVVATVAFGMGINKADVRFIVHFRPPMSIAAYAQESGRAGRDGKPARCVLLVTNSDRSSLRRLAHRDEIDLPMLRQVYAAIQRQKVDRWAIVDFAAIEQSLDVDEDDGRDRARIGVGVLDQAGLIARHQDVPVDRTLSRRPGGTATTDDPDWTRFLDWSGLADGGMVRVRTANACAEVGCAPAELEALLLAHEDEVEIRQEGPRLACLELKPAPADAAGLLQALIARTREETHRRIDEVFDYADTRQCRHVVLAAHLGEQIAPCGGVCDVCRGHAAHAPSQETVSAASSTPQRRNTTAADALAALEAVRTLPYPMGKTGLVRLMTGSAESRVRADRAPSFGVLQDVVKARVDALIDKLVDEGYLFRDLDHEFKLIHLTERGAAATAADLAAYDPVGGDEHAPLDGSEAALFDRLAAWRSERASRDGVPPYVVAHDTMLRAVARQRPGTPAELGTISGFGGKRVAKYGDEILAITNGF